MNTLSNTQTTEMKEVVMPNLGRPVDLNSARQKRLAEIAAKKADPNFKLGRPSNPESAAYKRRQELEAKRAAGLLKLGRPAVEGSKNQLKKAEMEAKKADPNYKPERGRPVNPESAAYKKRMELEAKRAAGEVHRGRPKGSTSTVREVVITPPTPEEVVTTNSSIDNLLNEIVQPKKGKTKKNTEVFA